MKYGIEVHTLLKVVWVSCSDKVYILDDPIKGIYPSVIHSVRGVIPVAIYAYE